MRPYLDAMWAEREPLVQRVARVVTGAVPGYESTPSSEVWIGMTRILERTVQGNPFADPTEDDFLAAIGTGVQGARAGIRPEDVVAAVLIGAREVEDDVMRRAAEDGRSAAEQLVAGRLARRWAEQVAVWAGRGATGAVREPSERHVLEGRLVTALWQREPEEALRGHAAALGVEPSRSWYVVVAAGDHDDVPVTALRIANSGGIWATASHGPRQAQTVGLMERIPQVPDGLIVGIDGPVPLRRLPDALVDAWRAGRVARRFNRRGIVTLGTLGLLVPLHEDPALAARLTARWTAPLDAEPRHELVQTLRMWLAEDGQIGSVAGALNVHANTVRNRLSRIGDLLGPGWRDPQHRAEIWAAIELRDSGRPSAGYADAPAGSRADQSVAGA